MSITQSKTLVSGMLVRDIEIYRKHSSQLTFCCRKIEIYVKTSYLNLPLAHLCVLFNSLFALLALMSPLVKMKPCWVLRMKRCPHRFLSSFVGLLMKNTIKLLLNLMLSLIKDKIRKCMATTRSISSVVKSTCIPFNFGPDMQF